MFAEQISVAKLKFYGGFFKWMFVALPLTHPFVYVHAQVTDNIVHENDPNTNKKINTSLKNTKPQELKLSVAPLKNQSVKIDHPQVSVEPENLNVQKIESTEKSKFKLNVAPYKTVPDKKKLTTGAENHAQSLVDAQSLSADKKSFLPIKDLKLSTLTHAAEKKDFNIANVNQLSKFDFGQQAQPTLSVSLPTNTLALTQQNQKKTMLSAIMEAVQRHPEITQYIASSATQSAYIDVAKSKFYPQISGGFSTGDITTGEKTTQQFRLDATQLLYDFGKVKSSVNIEEAKLLQEQARFIFSVDNIAQQVADAIINIKRYQEITAIADQQVKGIAKILEIASLRAEAGISSVADPVQAQSNLEAAQSNQIVQQSELRQYYHRLKILLGYDVSHIEWEITDKLINESQLYEAPKFNEIPEMMIANAGVEIAKFQKEQIKKSIMPSLNLRGSLSQAIKFDGSANTDDDFNNSLMVEATSNFYQGGGFNAQNKAASFAEEAARAQVNATYLEVLNSIQLIQEQVKNKQLQMKVLGQRRDTTVKTKELYEEQYKLGRRTVVDLLNAEQNIHSAAQEIVTAKYDIYSALAQYIYVTGQSRHVYNLNNIAIQGFKVQP